MTTNEQIEMKLFGLAREGSGDVRADVFAKKLAALVTALRSADRQSNGGKTYNYFIKDLKHSSAYAAVSEEPFTAKKAPVGSSIHLVQSIATSVRDGQGIPRGTDPTIAKFIGSIANGVEKTFSHGEIGIRGKEDTIVRFDKYYHKLADRALDDFRSDHNVVSLFEGVSFSTFDGTLLEVDLRGTVASAKLILAVGHIELDCTCNSVTVENLRTALDQRVTVSALAHYNGKDRMPEHLDIRKIDLAGTAGSLQNWRGKFAIPYPHDEDIW